MATNDVWILGIHMTKFGKHPDKDTVDLAAEAAVRALKDGGVTMRDMGVLAAGNLMAASAGIGQQLQKQIGQTGIPVYNVANACATGATALRTAIMAVKAGECDMGLAVGVEKLAGAGLLGARCDHCGYLMKETPQTADGSRLSSATAHNAGHGIGTGIGAGRANRALEACCEAQKV